MLKATIYGVLMAGVAVSSPALAQNAAANSQVTSLTVFGDSLVDAGNVNTLNPAVASSANGYFRGRFTNGYDYTDLLSIELFGAPTVASLQGGTNFAFGGARATTTNPLVPDLNEQLGIYRGFLAAGGTVDPTGLYVLNFGGNDIFAASAPGAPAGFGSDTDFLMQAARNYAQAIGTLAALGANNFFITDFPNATEGQIEFSLEANVYLLNEISSLSLDEDVNVNLFSYLDFFGRLSADPTQFGLPADLSFDGNCQAAGAVPNCSQFFSFDGIHPTAAVQRAAYNDIQRQFGFSAPVPEPSTWAMMLLGFFGIGLMLRRKPKVRNVTVAYT